MSQEFKLADSVIHRIVQIIQEGMLLGVDAGDLMRQIRLVHEDGDESTAVCSPAYVAMVQEHYTKLLKQAQELQAQKQSKTLIIDPSKDDSGESN